MFKWFKKEKSSDYNRGFDAGFKAGRRSKLRSNKPTASKRFRWADAEALDIWNAFTSGRMNAKQLADKYNVSIDAVERITVKGRYSYVLEGDK